MVKLLEDLLTPNPANRISWNKFLDHKIFQNQELVRSRTPPKNLKDSTSTSHRTQKYKRGSRTNQISKNTCSIERSNQTKCTVGFSSNIASPINIFKRAEENRKAKTQTKPFFSQNTTPKIHENKASLTNNEFNFEYSKSPKRYSLHNEYFTNMNLNQNINNQFLEYGEAVTKKRCSSNLSSFKVSKLQSLRKISYSPFMNPYTDVLKKASSRQTNSESKLLVILLWIFIILIIIKNTNK